MKQFVVLLTCIVCSLPAWAHWRADDKSLQADSNSVKRNFGWRLDRFSTTRLYRMTYIGVPLVIGGVLVKSEDDHFRNLRNDYLQCFDRRADNYLQYVPAAVMLGMKCFGVKGRSSWGRMLVVL